MSLRLALPAIAVLVGTACASASAAPVPAPAAPAVAAPATPGSVAIVQRLSVRRAAAMPDLTGMRVGAARAVLAKRGVDVQVIAVRRGARTVSAQWPEPGAAIDAAAAVVWLGRPPQPPPPPPVETAREHAAQVVPQPVAPAPQASGVATTPVQPGGRTPGLEGFVPPPHPPRSNIRTLPPAEAGTTLSGRASWYGPGFAGHTTACGGVFDPAQLTLASRELRCGTAVRVTGPSGAAVDAVVTDWGPAEWTGRRFDLSQATMAAVGGLGAGVIDVTVEVLGG